MAIDIDTELAAIRNEKSDMLAKVAPLKEQMAVLEEQIRELMDPHVARIREHEDNIRKSIVQPSVSIKVAEVE
jgi:tetrahydromethanopterin S-methyltransferase subunit B